MPVRMSRRRLLGAMGTSLATWPMLPSLLRAQPETASPKRLVVFFSPNEPIDKAHWEPSGSGSDRALPTTFPRLLRNLEPHRDKILMLGDLDMRTRSLDSFGGGHVGIGHMLTGRINIPYGTEAWEFWAGGISVDQFVANRLGVEALTLGVQTQGANGNGRISYRDVNEPVHPIENPADAFTHVFGDASLSTGERDVGRAQRASVLDALARGIGRTQARLGAAQRARLDRHLTAVRAIETRLATAPAATCDPGAAPDGGGDLPAKSRHQIDVLVEALACNVTRVATLQLGNSGGAENFSGGLSWPSVGLSYSKSQHVIAHDYNDGVDPDATARREAIETVYYDLFTYLLDRMDEVEEAGGTLLDNSIVLYTKNIGHNHSESPMFYMLAGGGGSLRTGRYVSMPGVPHNNLLVSLCQLMGLSDVHTFGDPDVCTGDLGI